MRAPYRTVRGPLHSHAQGFCIDQRYLASAEACASLSVPGSLNGMFLLMKACSEACVAKRFCSPASSFGPEAPMPPGPWQTWHLCWKSVAAAAFDPVGLPLAVVVPVVLGDAGGGFLAAALLLAVDLAPDFDALDFPLDFDELDLPFAFEEDDLLADCRDFWLVPDAPC
jgi:hypothetical protein